MCDVLDPQTFQAQKKEADKGGVEARVFTRKMGEQEKKIQRKQMEIKLRVTRQSDDHIETLGTLELFQTEQSTVVLFSCKTLERPDKGNAAQISCIPVGTYQWAKVPASHIPYEHIAIQNVPGREGICIHKGNFVNQILLEVPFYLRIFQTIFRPAN